MKASSETEFEIMQTQAAQWFAMRRRGVMSVDERRAYREWIAVSAHAQAMAQMENVWAWSGGMKQQPRKRVSHVAAAALCAATLALGVLSVESSSFWTHLDWVDR